MLKTISKSLFEFAIYNVVLYLFFVFIAFLFEREEPFNMFEWHELGKLFYIVFIGIMLLATILTIQEQGAKNEKSQNC